MGVLIIKIGGSVITNKDEKFSIRTKLLNKLAEKLSSINEKFVLVHGGGSFGHPLAAEYKINQGYEKEEQLIGFAKTNHAMKTLNQKVVEAFLQAGKPAVSLPASACTIIKNGEIDYIESENIQKLLDLQIIPILYGDAVIDQKKGINILSGDQLVAKLAEELKAEKVILGVDTEGICTKDPKKEGAELIPKITPKSWENIKKFVEFPVGKDITGGMKNKAEVLVSLAKKGIESKIVNATNPETLIQAIRSDKKVGTKIKKNDLNE